MSLLVELTWRVLCGVVVGVAVQVLGGWFWCLGFGCDCFCGLRVFVYLICCYRMLGCCVDLL